MQDSEGKIRDLYIPRKCSWTNRLITSSDHGAVPLRVGNVDMATGLYTGENTDFVLCGYIRAKGEGDMALTELVKTVPGINYQG